MVVAHMKTRSAKWNDIVDLISVFDINDQNPQSNVYL